MRYVLSLDWDFFTGDCSGNTMQEKLCEVCSWNCVGRRAPLPQQRSIRARNTPQATGAGLDIVDILTQKDVPRFTLEGTPFIVAECHASIYEHLQLEDVVINFDAHSDDNNDFTPCCGSWASYAMDHKDIQYYWIDSLSHRLEIDPPVHYELLFLCLSKPWTPPALDDEFYRAINALSKVTGVPPWFYGNAARELRRKYERRKRLDNVICVC